MKPIIETLSSKELLSYLKFRRTIILVDEYFGYLLLTFMLFNNYNIKIIIATTFLIFYTIFLRGYRPYWKLSNKYLVKESKF